MPYLSGSACLEETKGRSRELPAWQEEWQSESSPDTGHYLDLRQDYWRVAPPPMDILAEGYAWLYDARKALRRAVAGATDDGNLENGTHTPSGVNSEHQTPPPLKKMMWTNILDRWRERLDHNNLHGEALRLAFNQSGILEKWMKRPHGDLDHGLTQLLSGHGCYGNYVYWLRKAATP